MAKKECPTCEQGGSFPVWGEGFSRRRFLQIGGTGLVASFFSDVFNPFLLYGASASAATLHRTAKNCILIFLSGAPSHIDTWDLKEGPWTPASLAPTSFGEVRFPQGLLPKTAEQLKHLTFVRSGLSWAAVHGLAQQWAQISRNPTGALGSVAPHMGAVVAIESQAARKPNEILPGFISLNSNATIGAGYLPAKYAPFSVQPSTSGLTTLNHPDGAARLSERWSLINKIDAARSDGRLGRLSLDMKDFYDQAKVLVDSPEINQLFTYTNDESTRYGGTSFGNSMVIAKKLVASQRGTRFVQVTQGGWDHHSGIYDTEGNSLFSQCLTFDPAFGALIGDMAAAPGSVEGKTLLDETLVVVLAEFGRTVGVLNNQGGRDHFLRMSVVFAGGGVKGGKVIGKTDANGDKAIEYGWVAQRDVRPEDVTATIYSALGIDYTTVRRDDPLGRGFEYVPFAKDGLYQPISELFV